MSPHPFFVDEEMVQAMADCRAVCEHLHMPVQSGSDRLLKLMRRNYTRDAFLRKADMIRARHPRVVFSTDLIVGFPTETDADFQMTLSLVEQLAPASAYTFKYSPREGTESATDMTDDVPAALKEERLARLNEVVDRLTQDALKSQVGRTAQILTEQAGFGRTREGFNARWDERDAQRAPAAPGQLVSVRITGATRRTLLGERTDDR
jgi:tRNA-2-methylthio-N6-dimethylallyladenosine synthase